MATTKQTNLEMITKLEAEINKVYFINQYTLVHILEGTGSIEVDFKNYLDWQDKAIYLSKGQYIKFLSDDFVVRLIEFPDEVMFNSREVRVLFKHIISLGYIDFKECSDCQRYLSKTVFNQDMKSIIDVSTQQGYWQNPFQANKDEYQVIFDVKDVVDEHFTNNLSNQELVSLIDNQRYNAQILIKDKIGLSIKSLVANKRLLESKKEIAFSDKSIKEVAYNFGFNDPAYFNRVFKAEVGQNPLEFRDNFGFDKRDVFIEDIIGLIKTHHANEHQLEFYAQKMNLSVKALSKKVSEKMQTSLGKLIRHELIHSSKALLAQQENIQDISEYLGFEEPNHFSSFFKHHTGKTPSEFKIQKVQ